MKYTSPRLCKWVGNMKFPAPLASVASEHGGLHVTARLGEKHFYIRTISTPLRPQELAEEAIKLQRSYPAAHFFVSTIKFTKLIDGDLDDLQIEMNSLPAVCINKQSTDPSDEPNIFPNHFDD